MDGFGNRKYKYTLNDDVSDMIIHEGENDKLGYYP